MRFALLILAFANIGLGLWEVLHPETPVAPVRHSARVRVVAPRPKARPVPKRPRPGAKAAPASLRRVCWEIGPLATRRGAQDLLRRLRVKGRVRVRARPAYRVFLPTGVRWPPAATLARFGVHGAYVTHGVRGGEVLSLGVFRVAHAARDEWRRLRAGGIPARISPFGAPSYYDRVWLTSPSRAVWRSLGGVGHHLCG